MEGEFFNATQQACVLCSAGTHSWPGASECTACVNGKYSPAGASTCLLCDAGTYAVSPAATCSACGAGTFSAAGHSACQACPAGQVSTPQSSTCSLCSAGTYAEPASAACSECVAGKYSGLGSSSCFPCPAGTYAPSTRSSECTACPVNTFSVQTAAGSADACVPCAPGLYASHAATSCSACGAGARVQESNGVEVCEECPRQGVHGSASRFGEACPVTCVDNACVKAHMREANSTRNVSMREHIAAVYGARADVESALLAMYGTWEYTQLATRVLEVYVGHECADCPALTDPVTGQTVPLEAYRVAGAEGSCAPACDADRHYYARSSYPGQCVLCNTTCAVGEFLTGDRCDSCQACVPPVDANWHFTGRGALDDNTSCPWSCDEHHFLDYVLSDTGAAAAVREACIAHTVVSCDSNQYQVRGTHLSDAYCEDCQVSCEGRNQTAACSAFADAACTECAPPLSTLEAGAAYVHTNCTRACRAGYVQNRASGLCEFCAAECGAGFFLPIDRQNCTDCRPCTDALPANASYVDACTWACDEGFAFAAGACLSLLPQAALQGQSETKCAPGERLVWQAASFACEACDVLRPAAPVDSTWRWLPSHSSCAWECLPGYYRTTLAANVLDCLAWEAYQMQIISGQPPSSSDTQPLSATTINNVAEIEFRQNEREYETLSVGEYALLAGIVFGTLMLLMLTQT